MTWSEYSLPSAIADAQHLAAVADDVKPGDLAFLAAVFGIARQLERLLGRDQP